MSRSTRHVDSSWDQQFRPYRLYSERRYTCLDVLRLDSSDHDALTITVLYGNTELDFF